MHPSLPALVRLLVALTAANLAAHAQTSPVELLISGPHGLPLLTRGAAAKFTAVLINHSDSVILFVPPHPDWIDERWTTWQAIVPQQFIWCDPQGRMYAQPVFPSNTMFAMNVLTQPKQIRDSDLVVLEPGKRYELPHLGDPRFYLRFLNRGKYQLSLEYAFQPSHYRLLPHSPLATALAHASPLSLASNSLELTLY